MSSFTFKSFEQVLSDMVSKFISLTGVNDINPGSVVTTFLEAAAQEDAQQYFLAYQIIRNYVLDTTEGVDLDNRATEFGLTRLAAQKATGIVSFINTVVTPVKTKIYNLSRGPIAGQSYVDVDSSNGFTATGTIIIGRNTSNVETRNYSSITSFGNFARINLTAALTNDHGTDETVILSQGGDRLIPAFTVVKVPASDTNDEITFLTTQAATILDGESEIDGVPIIATLAGADSNVSAGSISQFDTLPFSTAKVTNLFPIVNGSDLETDEQLRTRIRNWIQSLSRGTKQAISSGVIGIESDFDNKRVVSANIIDAITLNDIAYLFIDDGTGLEPSVAGVGNEIIINSATGGEQFLQLDNFPVVKAQVISQSVGPFKIISGDTLSFSVGNAFETITFNDNDFRTSGQVTGYEVAAAINNKATLVEARTQEGGTRVVLRPKINSNENITVLGGSANSSNKLNFSLKLVDTIDLYRTRNNEIELLTKDGLTALIQSQNSEPYNLVGGEVLNVVVDNKIANPQVVTFQVSDFLFPSAATAEEVVIRINKDLSGATALVNPNQNQIIIKSNTTNSVLSAIQVTGGSANAILGFNTSTVFGKNRDFTLDRFNGQIELVSPALALDKYEVGTFNTRAYLLSRNSQPFALTNLDTISISLDGGTSQVITFNSSDFISIGAATASEVVTAINKQLLGGMAIAVGSNIIIQTNTWNSDIGSVEFTGYTGTGNNLGFQIGDFNSNFDSHVGYIVNTGTGPYNFTQTDNLIVVVDKNPTDNTFIINFGLLGSVITGDFVAPYTTFIANIFSISQNFNLRFSNNNDLKDFKIVWTTGSNTGSISTVSNYNGTTGQFILVTGLTNPIFPNDQFYVIPVTNRNVVTYLSNSVTSSLPTKADVLLAVSGNQVQISSKSVGTLGSVQVTGGTANSQLLFNTAQAEGRDGYEYYTGLLQKVQWIVDGLDSDPVNYPGLKAAGVQIEVLPPIVNTLSIKVKLIIQEENNRLYIQDKAADLISDYINGLGVGQDVVLNEIVDVVMEIQGMIDMQFLSPTSNIAIADNEIARIANSDIIFG